MPDTAPQQLAAVNDPDTIREELARLRAEHGERSVDAPVGVAAVSAGFDLVVRGARIMTTAGIVAREIGVANGRITALEPLGRARLRRPHRLRLGEPAAHVALVQLAEQLLLGAEVVHDRALGQAELGRHVAEVGAVVAPLGDVPGEGHQDLRAPSAAGAAGRAGGRWCQRSVVANTWR